MLHIKKVTSLILSLVMLMLCFAACEKSDDDTPATDNPTENISYESIERYAPSTYENKYFGISGSKYVLNLIYPQGWQFSEDNVISRNGKDVGAIYAGKATDTENWSEIKSEVYESATLSTHATLESSNTAPVSYRMRFEYSYKDTPNSKNEHIVTLVSDYAEISDFTLNKMTLAQSIKSISSDTVIGSLCDLEDAKSIAILGNSFIATSDVGDILSELFSRNGKHVSVDACSRGYATVETYATDVNMIANIKNGKYDAVFICGFYYSTSVDHLDTIKKACDNSNTKLVVFPAHNEKIGGAKSAVQRYNTIGIISWKEEIDRLILKGVDKWAFCYNDSHLHSTPLAGYVGAHMIYRAMYGEVPANGPVNSISQSEIQSALGDYAKTSGATYITKSEITYLK